MTFGTLNSREKISSKFRAESAFKGDNVFVTAALLRDKKKLFVHIICITY
jgi:hypothetical protein